MLYVKLEYSIYIFFKYLNVLRLIRNALFKFKFSI